MNLTLAVETLRAVVCFFQATEMFKGRSGITLRTFSLKSRHNPQQNNCGAEFCYSNLKLWTFRALLKDLVCKTSPLLGRDAISERGFHEAMNIIFCLCYGVVFLAFFLPLFAEQE